MNPATPLPLDLVISFDTTSSMNSVLDEVRKKITELTERLLKDIKDIRIAIIAHGDYGDSYETKIQDFSVDSKQLTDFIKNVEGTGGWDMEECYELVLQQTRTKLSWRTASTRALIVVGDSCPHEVGSKRNKYKIDWRAELELLRQMAVTVYSVNCYGYLYNSGLVKTFQTVITNTTGGVIVDLENFRNVTDFLMSIAYRETGPEFLMAFEKEIRARDGTGIQKDTDAMLAMLRTSSTSSNTTQVVPSTPPTVAFVRLSPLSKALPKPKTTAKPAKAKTARKKLKFTLNRLRREEVVNAEVSTKAALKWSAWKEVMRPGKPPNRRWKVFGTGCSLTPCFPYSKPGQMYQYEMSVQRSLGAKRITLFSAFLNRTPTVPSLLKSRSKVAAQVRRILALGMTVHVRRAVVCESLKSSKQAMQAELKREMSYAWNSGRSLRTPDGVYLSVSAKTLGL